MTPGSGNTAFTVRPARFPFVVARDERNRRRRFARLLEDAAADVEERSDPELAGLIRAVLDESDRGWAGALNLDSEEWRALWPVLCGFEDAWRAEHGQPGVSAAYGLIEQARGIRRTGTHRPVRRVARRAPRLLRPVLRRPVCRARPRERRAARAHSGGTRGSPDSEEAEPASAERPGGRPTDGNLSPGRAL
jgi:hypothetical protein